MDRPRNILITGAAGYMYVNLFFLIEPSLSQHSGGSVLAELLSRTHGPISGATVHAVVRSGEQLLALSKLGANIIKLDLSDGPAVATVVEENKSMSDTSLFAKLNADPQQLILLSIQQVQSIKYLFPICCKLSVDARSSPRHLSTSFM